MTKPIASAVSLAAPHSGVSVAIARPSIVVPVNISVVVVLIISILLLSGSG